MKKILAAIGTLLIVLVVGSLIMSLYLVFLCLGKIGISNPKDAPRLRPGMVPYANHSDGFNCMYEIILLPALFFCQAIMHPIKLAPWFAPDKRNFTDKWYWSWLRLMATPIVRGDKVRNGANGLHEARAMMEAVAKMKRVLMYFLEPGRTCTGKSFLFSKDGQRQIRVPTGFLALLAQEIPGTVFVPVWFETGKTKLYPGKPLFSVPDFSNKITVTFGKPIKLSADLKEKTSAEVMKIFTEGLLETAACESGS